MEIEAKAVTVSSSTGKGLARDALDRLMREMEKMAKRAEHSDAVMTGILVTRFKMGLIDVEGLELMAANTTRVERCSAARKVLVALRGTA
jgi:hypothetical protein